MDDFDKSLDGLIKNSAEIVTLEDELRELSKEHKEDTPEFRKKAAELKKLLDFEDELLNEINTDGLHEIVNRIVGKYQEKAKAIEDNKAAGKDPFEGVNSNLGTPLERLDLIVSDILENEEEEYVQCFDDDAKEEFDDENDAEEELDDEEDESLEEDEKPKEEYDEETQDRLTEAIDEIHNLAVSLPGSSNKDIALTENYTAHRLVDKQEKKYFKYMVIRSTIIAFQKLYSTIEQTPACDETEQKYKNDLLEFLQEFKYIVFLKTPQLEKLAADYGFNISAIPVPKAPSEDVSELRHNLCMSKISALYKTRIDSIDIETILECLKELLEILEHIDCLDSQALGNLLSYCEGIREILGGNNFGTYAMKAIKMRIKKNTNGGQNERREFN